MDNKTARDLLVISAVVLATLLPFIGKPFNVDDPFYLKAAEQLIKDPLRPYSYYINWSGELRDVWAMKEATFPPLVTAYTAAVSACFGEKEWILHLFFLVFPLAAAVSMYFISMKFTRRPLIPALLFALCPAFMVSATSIMLDVPLCALTLGSTALFIYGVDGDDKRMIFLGSLAAGLAVLAKYSGILIVPLFLACLYFSKKLKYWPYVLVPLGFLGLWSAHNLMVYGGAHFFLSSGHIGKGVSLHKIFAFGAFFGGCLIFPFFAMCAASLKEAKALAIWVAALFVFGRITLGGTAEAGLFSIFCTATLYFLFKTACEFKSIDRFVVSWFVIGFAAVMALEPWVSARYLLVILPPAVIIFAKIVETLPDKRGVIVSCAAVGSALVIGLSLGAADLIWAGSYKDAAGYIRDKGYNDGYFIGHFGFQYYLEKTGMTALEVNKPLGAGKYIVAARVPDPQKPSARIAAAMKLVELRPLESRFPLRLMNQKARAGFYSSYWGILPFNISFVPVDDIAVFEIMRGDKR